MPFVQLLDTGSSIIKRFSTQLVKWFESVAEQVTGRLAEECENNSDKNNSEVRTVECKKLLGSADETIKSGDQRESSEIKLSNDTQDDSFENLGWETSLFPARNNVDNRLGFNSSIVPCSLSIEGLQSPMSMSRTPEGQIEWKLNVAGDSNAKTIREEEPISPKSNNDLAVKSQEQALLPSDTPTSATNESSEKKFVCHYCDAEFKIRGYLTRHIKKHAVEKAYHCPFFDKNCPPEQRCHSTGGFSRRDTYKTHLRSRHFIYPANVKTTDRHKSGGHCGQCGKYFSNTNEWIEKHIEGAECEAIPEGFRGTLKNSRRCGKLKMIKTSTGHSRFISTQDSVVEPKIFLNKDALEAMQIVADEYSNSSPASSEKTLVKPAEKFEKGCGHSGPCGTHAHVHTHSPISSQIQSQTLPRAEPLPVASSYGRNSIEASLDEQYFSVDQSPVEDAALDSINSISSQSSHENTILNKDIQFSVLPQNIDDNWIPPLDAEQGGYDMNNENKPQKEANAPKINSTLERQMDDYALAERHFRETQQFLNFFNFTYRYEN